MLTASLLALLPLLAPQLPSQTQLGPSAAVSDQQLNLGLALNGTVTAGDDFVAFIVDERRNGDTDLNGDGDAFDRVLHVFDSVSRTTKSLGIGVETFFPEAVDGRIVFAADEGQNGVDLNGDGDLSDQVVHLYDHASRTTTNLGLSVTAITLELTIGRELVYVLVRESDSTVISGQGVDLNGDGDLFDSVAHIHRLKDGVTVNLGLAASPAAVEGGRVSFSSSESAQGTDLNGDGDQNDAVIHVYSSESEAMWNTGVAGAPIGFAADSLMAVALERQEGEDLNGDNDQDDFVLHRFDPGPQTFVNEGLAVNSYSIGSYPLEGRWLGLIGIESAQGDTDLNGDGDANDFVMHLYDAQTGTLTNLGLAAVAGGSFIGFPRLERGLLAFWVEEDAQGSQDLNGNGAAFDSVMHIHNAMTGATTNLALGCQLPATRVDRGIVAFLVSEPNQGVDLNGDGDQQDRFVSHLFDRRTSAVTNLGLACAGARFFPGRRYVSVLVDERDQGTGDLNGDGDQNDSVYHLFDTRDGSTINLGLAGLSAGSASQLTYFGRRFAAIIVDENSEERDLNGDGDQFDDVLFVLGL